jgi:hypothetical protein
MESTCYHFDQIVMTMPGDLIKFLLLPKAASRSQKRIIQSVWYFAPEMSC